MQDFAATKLDEFEKGKISRRRLLESLTIAATTSAATAPAASAAAVPDPALKISILNHISYTCPDFRRPAEWYTRLFNLNQADVNQRDTTVAFGRQGEKSLGIAAADVPLTYIIFRSPNMGPPPPNANPNPRRASRAVIGHVGYMVADFTPARALPELRALGVENLREDGPYSLRMTDPFGYEVKISGVENTALTAP